MKPVVATTLIFGGLALVGAAVAAFGWYHNHTIPDKLKNTKLFPVQTPVMMKVMVPANTTVTIGGQPVALTKGQTLEFHGISLGTDLDTMNANLKANNGDNSTYILVVWAAIKNEDDGSIMYQRYTDDAEAHHLFGTMLRLGPSDPGYGLVDTTVAVAAQHGLTAPVTGRIANRTDPDIRTSNPWWPSNSVVVNYLYKSNDAALTKTISIGDYDHYNASS